MPFRIMIGADLVPTESNAELFKRGDARTLVGDELLEKLNSADYTIFNLEVPLTDEQHPIIKCGPNLIAPTATIAGLKEINPHFFGLANNHILDQGTEGLASTVKMLKDADIEYSGVGKNLDEASKPFIKEIGGRRIGIYCCAEHEFSIATETEPGANPFDPLESLDHVEALKKKTDYVIVLYHGGKEHYRYPSPYLQKVCRRLVDKGADLVVCQHTHCIGCEEKYKDGTIVYGQGNFLFDDSDNEFWQTGMLIELNASDSVATMNEMPETEDICKTSQVTGVGDTNEGSEFTVSYVPIVKDGNKVRLAETEKAKEILDTFQKRSEQIKQPEFVNKNYTTFAEQMEKEYLHRFSGAFGRNIFVRALNKFTSYGFMKKLYPVTSKVAIENVLDCEAHRELAIEALRRCRR